MRTTSLIRTRIGNNTRPSPGKYLLNIYWRERNTISAGVNGQVSRWHLYIKFSCSVQKCIAQTSSTWSVHWNFQFAHQPDGLNIGQNLWKTVTVYKDVSFVRERVIRLKEKCPLSVLTRVSTKWVTVRENIRAFHIGKTTKISVIGGSRPISLTLSN